MSDICYILLDNVRYLLDDVRYLLHTVRYLLDNVRYLLDNIKKDSLGKQSFFGPKSTLLTV